MSQTKQSDGFTFDLKPRDMVMWLSLVIGAGFGFYRWYVVGSGEFWVNILSGIATGMLMGLTLIIIVTGVEWFSKEGEQ